MKGDEPVFRTYLASAEICTPRQPTLPIGLAERLYVLIEDIVAESGLKKYSEYLLLKADRVGCLWLNDRTDPATIADFATSLMLKAQVSLIGAQLKIALHYEHVIKYPHLKLEASFPGSGRSWAFWVRTQALPGEILLSHMLWTELRRHSRIGPRLQFARMHRASTGIQEKLYALAWATAPVSRPPPAST